MTREVKATGLDGVTCSRAEGHRPAVRPAPATPVLRSGSPRTFCCRGNSRGGAAMSDGRKAAGRRRPSQIQDASELTAEEVARRAREVARRVLATPKKPAEPKAPPRKPVVTGAKKARSGDG